MHFAELARKHSSQIYKGSLRMLQKRDEDNLQNVLLQTFRNINSFEGKSQFSTRLVRVAINAVGVYAVGPDSPGDLYPGCRH